LSQSYAKERQGIGESEAIEPSAYFRELCGHVENHRDEDSRERGTVRRYDSLVVNLHMYASLRPVGLSEVSETLSLQPVGLDRKSETLTLSLKPVGPDRKSETLKEV